MNLSRRQIIKRTLVTGAYAAPSVVAMMAITTPAAAVTFPTMSGGAMATGTITFSPVGQAFVGRATGLPPGLPLLFLLASPDGSVLSQSVVVTDGTGGTTITVAPANYTVGGRAAPATVVGGNLFVFLADTNGTVVSSSGATATAQAAQNDAAATRVAATTTAIAAIGTFPPVAPTKPSGPDLIGTATAAAKTAAAGIHTPPPTRNPIPTIPPPPPLLPAQTATAAAQQTATAAAQTVAPPQPPPHPAG